MVEYPNLYVIGRVPSIGEMGECTIVHFKEICSICKMKSVEYQEIAIKFDRWDGEDLISVGGTMNFVSKRLKTRLEENEIKGIDFQEAKNEKESFFKFGKKAYQDSLPIFYFLKINSSLDGPEIWWERTYVCPGCQDQKWEITMDGISSTISPDSSELYVPRKVFRDSWHGENIFNLLDPGLPLATQKFIDVVNSFGGRYKFPVAEWA